jgi:hypothetical protein
MTPTSATVRSIAAEARFVTEGHHVRLDTDRHLFLVKSDSTEATYEVTLSAQGAELRTHCTCPAGRYARHGRSICKHGLGCLRRGEREGWARWDGVRWVLAGDLARAVAAA